MKKYILFVIVLLTMKCSIFAMGKVDLSDPDVTPPRSLAFLDTKQSPDMLAFLKTSYPNTPLTSKNDLLKIKTQKIQETMDDLNKVKITYEKFLEERWLTSISQKLTRDDNGFLPLVQEKTELTSYFKFNRHSSFPMGYQAAQQDMNRTYIKDIILGAQWIDFIRQEHGDFPVVFLGRTPCFLQVAYEEICKKESPENPNCCDHIYHLNFSGSPDIENTRTNSFFTSDKRKVTARNLVTTARRDFYCEYMTQKGMDRIGPKFYLVDMISTGAGLNSALRTMRFYYEQYLNMSMPDIHFMGLALPLNSNYSTRLYTYEAGSSRITFNNLPELGVRPLVITASPIYVNYRTVDKLLDNDPFQMLALHGIEFPAEKWDKEFTSELEEGGSLHNGIYSTFRSQVQTIIGEILIFKH